MIPTLILAGKVAAFLLVAACIVRARENARIRRVRREMRAALLLAESRRMAEVASVMGTNPTSIDDIDCALWELEMSEGNNA